MAKAFSIRDFMNDGAQQQETESDIFEKVSVFDIKPNPKNEYELSEIEKMKDSIYALGGVQQNLVLVKFAERAEYKYLALDGHRRLKASMELVEEGYPEFEFVPAVIRGQIDMDTEDAIIVMMNSTQRNKTDWEKVMEHMRLKKVIPKLKKRKGLDGRTREIESELLGVSEAQVAIYNAIGTKLDAWLMGVFKDGSIGISLAYEAARLEPAEQKQLVRITMDKGWFAEEDIKRLTGSRVIKGQQRIQENVSDSDTSGETADASVHNVSDSDTFAETKEEPVHIPAAEKKEICYTTNEDDVDEAVYFIFRLNNFPEDKLQELIGAYRKDQNHIAAENVFYKMLPLENSDVKVIYQMGYQVEYIHTGEIVKIPVYNFWKGFEKEFDGEIKREAALTDAVENVSDSDTSVKMPDVSACNTAAENVSDPGAFAESEERELRETKFRGGYTIAMADHLIGKYEGYLDMAEKEEGLGNLVCEYSCLLDALDMLRDRLAREENNENCEDDN